MKGPADVEDPRWTSHLGEDLEEVISAHQVESLCEISKGSKQWRSLFPAFLLQPSEGEDHVSSGPVCPEYSAILDRLSAST